MKIELLTMGVLGEYACTYTPFPGPRAFVHSCAMEMENESENAMVEAGARVWRRWYLRHELTLFTFTAAVPGPLQKPRCKILFSTHPLTPEFSPLMVT